MIYQGGGERRKKRIEYWIFAGGQSWLMTGAPVVCGQWERALVGERKESEGQDAREAQIPNNQMWHHKNVIIPSHVHQLRMYTETRPQS